MFKVKSEVVERCKYWWKTCWLAVIWVMEDVDSGAHSKSSSTVNNDPETVRFCQIRE